MLGVLREFNEVSLYSLSSFPCEHIFSYLRTHCSFDNSIDAASAALKAQNMSAYVDWVLKENSEGNILAAHTTTTVKTNQFASEQEYQWLWELSGHVEDLIYGTKCTLHNNCVIDLP